MAVKAVTSKIENNLEQIIFSEQALIARVITQATTVENMLNAYIADFYTRCPRGDYQAAYLSFVYDIMNDRSMSLYAKVGILFKVYKRLHGKCVSKSTKSLFEEWLSIRNKFAHGSYIPGSGILYNGVFYEVEELANKHATLQIRILATLEDYSDLRGPYFNQFPLKEAMDSSQVVS